MSNVNDKVIVVTGGAGLLGRTFIEGILKSNGIAIIADIDFEKGMDTERELCNIYGERSVLFHELDITSNESINILIKAVLEKYQKIDALVNNAYPRNINYGRHFFDVRYKDFCENTSLHLGGYFLMMQQFANFFKGQGWGNIVNISSIYGVIAPRFEIYADTKMTVPVEYAAIKSAIIHLTRYTAKYLKGKNIRVNSISPGGIFDNQPDSFLSAYKLGSLSKGMLDKSDILGTLLFLLSDNSKYINGQNITIDDGFTL